MIMRHPESTLSVMAAARSGTSLENAAGIRQRKLQLSQHSGVVNVEPTFALQFIRHALLDQAPPKALAVELRLALRRGFLPAKVHPRLSVFFKSHPHDPNIPGIAQRAIFDRVGRKFMDRECDNLGGMG